MNTNISIQQANMKQVMVYYIDTVVDFWYKNTKIVRTSFQDWKL